jgi:hypothetical protein
MQARSTKAATRPPKSGKKVAPEPDDSGSVASRLGADESKERFEKKLAKIANVKKSKS